MAEILGLIASIIGIVSAILATTRFILRRRIAYRNVLNLIEEHFERWKKAGYSSRANSLIAGREGYEQFKQVNKFRNKLRNIGDEKLAFLLRCAVQNGMGGEWGNWLVMNKNNDKIIPALITALDVVSAGWRPMWRAVYILEKTFGEDIKRRFDQLPDEKRKDESIQFAFKVMSEVGLRSIS